ncbi:RNA polymerase sigma factor [Paenibacillus sp. GYB003]|uniref:RNA polymerase sigma factor n=1 Tax=Paenibacillus sp. GYB003 TaxID=2994392 RepID=UPI002F96D704
MDIEEALEAVARGNVEALRIVYERYRHIVYSVAVAIVKEKQAAEDVLHDTFVRVYEKAHTYRTGTRPKAWIASIARNLAYDAYRQRKRAGGGCGEPADDEAENRAVQSMELRDALARLDVTERQIVVLHLVAGLKHREIGEQLGIPAGTVRWKYRRSLARLAETIGGGEYDGTEPTDLQAEAGTDAERP